MNNYDDIINLSRPKSNHKHMSIESRAAQFSPFSALTGYDSKINETKRLTFKKKNISEESLELINSKLNYIHENLIKKEEITIQYFKKDLKKQGGKYLKHKGIVKKINKNNKTIKFCDDQIIKLEDIIDINSNTIDKLFE